jgi:5'-3' exoribonuclease 1
LKRLDTGALVKDYEGPEKEMTVAYQMAVSDVTFEDERYVVRHSPQFQLELS